VATTIDPEDEVVVEFCRQRGYDCARGSIHDVLDRYYQAALAFGAEVIVRITADCPVIDPNVIDLTIQAFFDQGADFSADRLPPPWGRTYPIGLDVEVCSIAGLELAWKEAFQPHQREHVMPFFYEQLQRFRIVLINHDPDYGSMRWTVDTAEDLELLRQVFLHFKNRDDFSWLALIDLFQQDPELAQINKLVQHKHYQAVDERRFLSQG
jgi:spore coat polysaccharide biosynthesis protein SpsF